MTHHSSVKFTDRPISSTMFAVLGAALLACASAAPAVDPVYWWEYPFSDCGFDDVPGSCQGQSVEQCKAMCLKTSGCGGFNYPHGVLKKTDCLSHKKPSTVTLYVIESTPPPPTAPTPGPPPPATNFPPLWPYPAKFTNGTTTTSVDAGLTFTDMSSTKTNTIAAAFARYTNLVFWHGAKPTGDIKTVQVTVENTDESHPQLGDDESYTLNIPSGAQAVSITAKTIWGALHALESFSQLVRFDHTLAQYVVDATPWSITDAPRFPHRGLMIDTSRHFQTLASIRKIVDSLPYAKINTLHWHMSDDQSFPMQSKSHPKMWDGAYSEVEKYTQADIAAIVEYARLRGVRCMVEFDMPGHASSWCKGYPEVCPSTTCQTPLNVANNATFDLITDLLNEMTGGKASTSGNPSGLFPENLIHLGGDEVNTDCWTKVPAVQAWLTAHNMTGDDGYAYFVKRAASIAMAQGRRPVQWVEVFDHFGSKLDKRTIVHVWKDKSTLNAVVAAGYNALINNSPGSNSWYLDHLTITWDAVYGNEPCETIPDAAQCALVLGGQGEMWGETVDASDIQSTVWPRLGAIAERLWSPRDVNSSAAAKARMEAFRCRLNRRGISAAPVNNGQARESPPGPGSCFNQ
eukprot:m.319055 g.319055  ORF g.319055 m.319055 type:complete len:630 (+) comp16445_c0_seq70:3-1892(+)